MGYGTQQRSMLTLKAGTESSSSSLHLIWIAKTKHTLLQMYRININHFAWYVLRLHSICSFFQHSLKRLS